MAHVAVNKSLHQISSNVPYVRARARFKHFLSAYCLFYDTTYNHHLNELEHAKFVKHHARVE